jgi:hypothetical protein
LMSCSPLKICYARGKCRYDDCDYGSHEAKSF